MSHEPDTVVYSVHGTPNWQDQIHAALDPYAIVDDHTIDIPAAAIVPAARYGQAQKAAVLLEAMVDAWQARGMLGNLDSYLARRVPGEPHPLGWSKHYLPFNDAVQDAADVLRHGGAS